jgi:hypothetical protein
MIQSSLNQAREQIVDTMIELTRLSNLHRVIIAGDQSRDIYLALHRRGLIRVSTTSTCRVARGQHAVGLIAGQNTLQALDAALAEISHFLNTTASIAVSIDCHQTGANLKIRNSLERLGFRIEAGVRCLQGFVLSGYRESFGQMEKAA